MCQVKVRTCVEAFCWSTEHCSVLAVVVDVISRNYYQLIYLHFIYLFLKPNPGIRWRVISIAVISELFYKMSMKHGYSLHGICSAKVVSVRVIDYCVYQLFQDGYSVYWGSPYVEHFVLYWCFWIHYLSSWARCFFYRCIRSRRKNCFKFCLSPTFLAIIDLSTNWIAENGILTLHYYKCFEMLSTDYPCSARWLVGLHTPKLELLHTAQIAAYGLLHLISDDDKSDFSQVDGEKKEWHSVSFCNKFTPSFLFRTTSQRIYSCVLYTAWCDYVATANGKAKQWKQLITFTEEGGNIFSFVGWLVCQSVNKITQTFVDGFSRNLVERWDMARARIDQILGLINFSTFPILRDMTHFRH